MSALPASTVASFRQVLRGGEPLRKTGDSAAFSVVLAFDPSRLYHSGAVYGFFGGVRFAVIV
jgi:hypothetical protein